MKVYVITGFDTMSENETIVFGVHATSESAYKQVAKEVDSYGGPEECDFVFEITEHEVEG